MMGMKVKRHFHLCDDSPPLHTRQIFKTDAAALLLQQQINTLRNQTRKRQIIKQQHWRVGDEDEDENEEEDEDGEDGDGDDEVEPSHQWASTVQST